MLVELPLTRSSEKFNGYELLHPSITNAVVNLLQKLNLVRYFLSQENIPRASIVDGNERYIGASLDWLSIEGHIRYSADRASFSVTDSGRGLLSHATILSQVVETYDAIVSATETALAWGHEGNSTEVRLQRDKDAAELESQYQLEVLLPAAISVFAETRTEGGTSLAQRLEKGEFVHLSQDGSCAIFIEVLEQLGLIEEVAEGYRATEPKGRKMFSLSGGAELITSYFITLQKLHELAIGELQYGLEKEVNRHGRLNANASNRIIEQRVIPYILERAFQDIPVIKEILERENAAFLDYGSGGGENMIRVLEEEGIKAAYGLDISGPAIAAAQENVDIAGKAEQATFIKGSIADAEDLKRVKSAMERSGIDAEQDVITAVSAIMHDIGPALTRDFLAAHKSIFPNAPIIVTENFKVSPEVLESIPAYQPAYFQFLHQISGQHLYGEQEFRDLLAECGYDVVSEEVHASVPDRTQAMDEDEEYPRVNTAITWVMVPKK